MGTRAPIWFKEEYEELNGEYDEQYGNQYTGI
jgi:hypothetical protein